MKRAVGKKQKRSAEGGARVIREAAAFLNISPENLLYYERRGLLRHTGRRLSRYSRAELNELRVVLSLRKIGTSIKTIRQYLQGNLVLPVLFRKQFDRLRQEGNYPPAKAVCRHFLEIPPELCTAEELEAQIAAREIQGEAFADIRYNWMGEERGPIQSICKTIFFIAEKPPHRFRLTVLLLTLIACIIFGVITQVQANRFWQGFFPPLKVFIGIWLLLLPMKLLQKRLLCAAYVYIGAVLFLLIECLVLTHSLQILRYFR